MRKKRKLSAEERALWDSVAQQAKRLGDKPAPEPEVAPQAPPNKPATKPKISTPPKPQVGAFRVGAKASATKPPSRELSVSPTVVMDARLHAKMMRGKLSPEARIDLHGMTLAQAHPALTSFVIGSHAIGRRLVLVITGKGRNRDEGGPIPTRAGMLRHQVPQWLAMPPLSPVILQVRPAARNHGGEGAYYVYLKK